MSLYNHELLALYCSIPVLVYLTRLDIQVLRTEYECTIVLHCPTPSSMQWTLKNNSISTRRIQQQQDRLVASHGKLQSYIILDSSPPSPSSSSSSNLTQSTTIKPIHSTNQPNKISKCLLLLFPRTLPLLRVSSVFCLDYYLFITLCWYDLAAPGGGCVVMQMHF